METAHDEPILEAAAGAGESAVMEGAAAVVHPGDRLAWENYVRCLFLVCIFFVLGFITWRPGLVRLSLLRSFVNPTRGDSLAWTPEPDPAPSLPEIKRALPPAEWRLSPAHSGSVALGRPSARGGKNETGALKPTSWQRRSDNPWRWQNDAAAHQRRNQELLAATPPQKSASPFRAGDLPAWPETTAPVVNAASGPAQGGLASLPSLPPPLPSNEPGRLSTPLPLAPSGGESAPAQTAGAGLDHELVLQPLTPLPPTQSPQSQQPTHLAQGGGSASPQPSAPAQSAPVDWKNREITGPIPGAYLTIYPKLKFIGLCAPGQGYIRKYNQVGVPADLTNPKMEARDSRTPYGRYYIADRHRDVDGPRLYLSWPSPEDARRIGLDAGKLAEIDQAWRTQSLPPQDTAAGGGVGLNGLRNWVEVTEGGFALEEPHMEEIFTALPDKAWVFVQP